MRSIRPWSWLAVLSMWAVVLMAAGLAAASSWHDGVTGKDWRPSYETVHAARKAAVSLFATAAAFWLLWTGLALANVAARTGRRVRRLLAHPWWGVPLLTPAFVLRTLWRESLALAGDAPLADDRRELLVTRWWAAFLGTLALAGCWVAVYQFDRALAYQAVAPATIAAGALAAALGSAVLLRITRMQDAWPDRGDE